LTAEPAPLADYAQNVPDGIQDIVSKTLRKDREHRYQSARELLEDLQEVKEELALQTRQSRNASGKASSGHKSSREQIMNTAGGASATGSVTIQTAATSDAVIQKANHSKRNFILITAGILLAVISAITLFTWKKNSAPKPPSLENLQQVRATLTG